METCELSQKAAESFQLKLAGIRPNFRVKHRRSAMERLKSRNYYRRHRAQIKLWRRRYSQRMKMLHHARKFLKRSKPSWLFHKGTPKVQKPKSFKHFLHSLVKGQSAHSYHPARSTNAFKPFKIHVPKKSAPAKALAKPFPSKV
jgi:hypothetical protein